MVIRTNVTQVVRGNPITFTTVFYDANNNIATAQAANLTVTYLLNLTKTSNTIAMSSSDGGNTWIGTWSSTGVDPGIIDWHITSVGISTIAEDGSIRILANEANQ